MAKTQVRSGQQPHAFTRHVMSQNQPPWLLLQFHTLLPLAAGDFCQISGIFFFPPQTDTNLALFEVHASLRLGGQKTPSLFSLEGGWLSFCPMGIVFFLFLFSQPGFLNDTFFIFYPALLCVSGNRPPSGVSAVCHIASSLQMSYWSTVVHSRARDLIWRLSVACNANVLYNEFLLLGSNLLHI